MVVKKENEVIQPIVETGNYVENLVFLPIVILIKLSFMGLKGCGYQWECVQSCMFGAFICLEAFWVLMRHIPHFNHISN